MDCLKTGLLIAQARKAQGMTQQDLANRLHITDRAVSKWERGISFPDVSVLESLSEVLGLSLSQLITGDHDAAGGRRTPARWRTGIQAGTENKGPAYCVADNGHYRGCGGVGGERLYPPAVYSGAEDGLA